MRAGYLSHVAPVELHDTIMHIQWQFNLSELYNLRRLLSIISLMRLFRKKVFLFIQILKFYLRIYIPHCPLRKTSSIYELFIPHRQIRKLQIDYTLQRFNQVSKQYTKQKKKNNPKNLCESCMRALVRRSAYSALATQRCQQLRRRSHHT